MKFQEIGDDGLFVIANTDKAFIGGADNRIQE
jgi:hypothetical protein